MSWLADHWVDVMGWGGSALLVYSLLQTRVLRLRTLNLLGCLILLAFNAIIGVWPMVGMNTVVAAINVWFIARMIGEAHDDEVFEVLAVQADDAYLAHVLRTHAADIARFQPDWDGLAPGDLPFLVQRGDETVGVAVIRPDGGDVARIRLDYVTERYRDFTPGEFVWRRSGLLRELGLRRVTTPPAMVDAYYGRLGFRREGAEYVLDL